MGSVSSLFWRSGGDDVVLVGRDDGYVQDDGTSAVACRCLGEGEDGSLSVGPITDDVACHG